MTLKAVAAEIGRTHANLLHHFGSAAGLQGAACAIDRRFGHQPASPTPSSAPAPARPMRATSSTGPSTPSAAKGAGALAAWMILTGNRDALDPILDSIRGLVAQLSVGHEEHHVAESTLSLVLSALGDSLLGAPIADALGLPRDTARELAAERLRARLDADHSAELATDGVARSRLERVERKLGQSLEELGPGLVTGAADDDPSGIATYSQAGAQFGYGLLWTMLLMLSADVGGAAGQRAHRPGHRRRPRQQSRRHLPEAVSSACWSRSSLIANIINIGADLSAMAEAAQLVVGGGQHVFVIAFALVSILLQLFVPYQQYARILKWLTLSLFAYVGGAPRRAHRLVRGARSASSCPATSAATRC